MTEGVPRKVEENSKVKPLDRYLSPIDVWALAFGCMVGWGVFAMPGTVFLPVAGPAGTILSMLIGMGIMLVIGRNFSYLMGRNSMTGGVYTYTKEAFGRDHAFLSSWFLCLSYLTIVFLNGTALFFIVRTLFADAVHTGFHYTVAGNTIYLGETLVSVLVLAGVGALFIGAKPLLQRIHTVLAMVLFAGVLVTAAFCLPHAVSGGAWKDFGIRGLNRGYAVLSLIVMAPWAYVGFEVTAFDTAHFKFPMKKSGRIITVSILAATLAYIAMALVGVASVPDGFGSWQAYLAELDGLRGIASVPTFFAARSIMGSAGLVVMTATAVAAILTGIIGGYRATTRVLSTMAEDRILSEKFSRTTYSILFIMLLSILLSLLGRNTLNWFVDLTSFGAIVGFGYTSAAAYKIAKTEDNKKTMATGMIGAVISVVLGIVQLVPRLAAMEAMGREAFLMLSLWCLLGFVFYWRTVVRSTLAEFSGLSTSGIVLFALLVYSALMWLAKLLASGQTAEEIKKSLLWGGIVLMLIIFVGLAVMLYVQNVVRKKHEASEREKIHAVESSLAKSQFLFNISHDIRTPMNAIVGYTNLAQKETSPEQIRTYLEDEVLPELSAHLQNSELDPLPEIFLLEPSGLTLLYPVSQLSTLGDRAGDIRIGWHVLKDVLNLAEDSIPDRIGVKQMITLTAESAEQLLAASAEGSLTGIPVKLGDSVQEMTDRYHLLTDPDGFEGGRLFALEGGCFRGVYLMTDDLTRGWENSKVEGIRMDQGCLWGLCVNETMREDWISVLGEPDGSAAIDEEKAEANRLVPGTCDYYSCGEYQLRLYSDDTGCLICIVLTA